MSETNSKHLKIKYLEGEINLENIPFIIKGIEIISQKWEKKNVWRSDYNIFELEENIEKNTSYIVFNYSFIPNNCTKKLKLIYLSEEIKEPKKYRLV